MVKYKEIIKRFKQYKITGISSAVFGISWETKKSDKNKIKKILLYLEDRRVLYLQYEPHMKKANCVQSVLNIREYLSTEIAKLSDESDLIPVLRYLRASCRKFLLRIEPYQYELNNLPKDVPIEAKFIFSTALGELRSSFGDIIALFCVKYELDISDELGSILPIEDDDKLLNDTKTALS